MLVTNQTANDYWFGPLHLAAGIGETLTVDDTTETSLYLTSDAVADAINNLYAAGKITVSGQADPFPRPTGVPQLLHGDGVPEGLVYAPQGSMYMRRDNTGASSCLYVKTTGITISTGWFAVAAGLVTAPSGTIVQYGGTTAPTDWLLCDGSAVSRTDYADLFTAIGTAFGAGDGSTTFNLPDLRGRVAVGYAATGGHTDVSTIGNNDGIAEAHRRPKHTTTVTDPGHVHTPHYATGSGASSRPKGGNTDQTDSAAEAAMMSTSTTGITAGTGVGTDPVDTPAYLVVNHIIKT